MNNYKKIIICILCIILSCSFISCSQPVQSSVTENNNSAEISARKAKTEAVIDDNWLYQGYWLYSLEGGEDTDIFVFQFLDEQTFNFTSYYSVTETTFDSAPVFTEEKYLLSLDKDFGIFVGNEWHFAFNHDKGKLYVRTSEGLYDEVLNYDEITDKTLNDCYKTYNKSNKYINIEIDDSAASYNIFSIALDYTPGNENFNGNPSVNPANSRITYQDGYYYFFDGDCNIRKLSENELNSGYYPMTLYSEYSENLNTIFSISVSKNFIYYSASSDDGYYIYSMPTSYVSGFYPAAVTQIYDVSFFIFDGKIYFLCGEDISGSSKNVSLGSIDPENDNTQDSICEIGVSKKDVSIMFDGISEGYAYITKCDSSSGNSIYTYLKINLSSGDKSEFTPEGYADHGAARIIDGKLYFILNEYADYMIIDFDNRTVTHINPGSSLGWNWKLVTIMDDEAVISGKYDLLGTYKTTLNSIKKIADYNSGSLDNGIFPQTFSGENIGVKLTDDNASVDGMYRFGNTIFYLTGSFNNEKIYKINDDGSEWREIGDLSPTE